MPPPVAPLELHTTSPVIPLDDALSRVAPQPTTCGLDAGKSTCALPSRTPSLEPLSPAAQNTVIPTAAASTNAWSNALNACGVHAGSGPPQLIEMIDGWFA